MTRIFLTLAFLVIALVGCGRKSPLDVPPPPSGSLAEISARAVSG